MAAYEYWRVRVQFTAGVWTDVTADVDTMAAPIRATTGATAETTGEPASLSLVLHNPGFKYTPGSGSPTALATGQPIQYYEIIADQVVYLFTGFVEFPEIDSVNLSMTQTQGIAVSAIDQLSAWERSPTFVSTLGAHIVGNAGATLRAYYPFDDAGAVQTDKAGSGHPPITVSALPAVATSGGVVSDTAAYTPNGADSVYADDLVPAEFTASIETVAGTIFSHQWFIGAATYAATDLPLAVDEVLTVVAWVRSPWRIANDSQPINLVVVEDGSTTAGIGFYVSGNAWTAEVFGGSPTGIITGPIPKRDSYQIVAVRYGFNPKVFELWVDGAVFTGSLTGAAPSTTYVRDVQIPTASFEGGLTHVQFYVGAATAWTFADFAAQRQVGLTGLERQTTGDRIRTIAGYAGLDGGALINVDTGCSVMRPARLAGQTIAAAMYEARDTERGDLFIDGAGLLTFHDRRTIYNI